MNKQSTWNDNKPNKTIIRMRKILKIYDEWYYSEKHVWCSYKKRSINDRIERDKKLNEYNEEH